MAKSKGEHAQDGSRGGDGSKGQPSILEWIMAAVGFVIVAGTLGFVLSQALGGHDSPPDVTVRVLDVVQTSDGYLAQIAAQNGGDSTAKALNISGELKRGDESIESSDVTMDYLPGHARRDAGLFFSNDPREYTLEVRAKGYEEP